MKTGLASSRPRFAFARDTVDEKKRALVSNIIATEASFFKSLTQADVKGLFE